MKIILAIVCVFLSMASVVNAEVCCSENYEQSWGIVSDAVKIQVPNIYAIDQNGIVVESSICPDGCCFACGTKEVLEPYNISICRPVAGKMVRPDCGEKVYTPKKKLIYEVNRIVVVPCEKRLHNPCIKGEQQKGIAYKMVVEKYKIPEPIETWVLVDCEGNEIECTHLK